MMTELEQLLISSLDKLSSDEPQPPPQPSLTDRLPASLICRDCKNSVIFKTQSDTTKVYCKMMNVITFDPLDTEIIEQCSRHTQ